MKGKINFTTKLTQKGGYISYYNSPIGTIELSATEKGIYSLYFIEEVTGKPAENTILNEAMDQLSEYFNKKRKIFSVPLDFEGTEFQISVWNELLNIPYGKTSSYLQIASRIGDKNSTRAVGNANGKNPVSIIIPCHRVIGTNGNLIGYGGGIERKKWLLELEGVLNQHKIF